MKWLQENLGLGDREPESLVKHRDIFLKEKQRFSEEFFRYFWEIKETRIILDHEMRGPHLKKLWEQWYGLIFTEAITPRVLGVLWRSGLRHVELNIDKRFINLGYAFVRQFFHETAKVQVPPADLLGSDPAYQESVKKTPALIPFIPIYSVVPYKWIKG